MKIERVIRKVIDRDRDGVQVNADIDAVVAGNVNEPCSASHASSRQRVGRISQRQKRNQRDTGEKR
jgi:hypothetical protein